MLLSMATWDIFIDIEIYSRAIKSELIVAFNGNNVHAKASHCYVIHSLIMICNTQNPMRLLFDCALHLSH